MRTPEPVRSTREKSLILLEAAVGAASLGSGTLLALRPDGAFLHSGPSALRRTPFHSWRVPGLLLASGFGGGYLLAALLQLRRHRYARAVGVAAGSALVVLEAWEAVWLEYQPLLALYAAAGGAVAALAWKG
ncbi:hypothetical protein [Arthrobacter caoxuetaonis]|uniref:hypothetical protein n=1 Tax=Arthrobacter caoxuetaonis TaxID=2886935 RepID=UPI001D153747|nr:hypothetical protein [Arthrobacter caoxuetaonis]MCC3283522.1 hypothetical protein [Arthrobacter caoxuetaonis]